MAKNNAYHLADSVYRIHAANAKQVNAIRIYKPSSPSNALRVAIETVRGASYARADEYSYDQYSGKLLAQNLFADLSNGEKFRRMNYYIHVGSIGGLTGKSSFSLPASSRHRYR